MRIAVDASRADWPRPTGTERYARELCTGFGADPGPHQWTFYSGTPLRREIIGQARNTVLSAPRLWTHVGLAGAMVRDQPDALFVPAHVIPAIHPAASLVTVHDLGYLRYRLAYSPLAWIYLVMSTIWSATVARTIICDSQATEGDLVQHIPAVRGKTRVVHLGVSPKFRPMGTAATEALGNGRDYLLFVGTMQPRKNLARLLRAYKWASCNRGFPRLVIAGSPARDAERIGHLIDELGLTERVWPVGYVAQEDLPALYSGALAFVFPSLYEGFGLPLLEAMACGTPVIAGRNSSMPEIVGDSGLLVDASNTEAISEAIRRVVDDRDLRQRLIARGQTRAAAFTWSATVARVRAAIEDAAG
ncbi:MAG: glycosyltransferase family 1 protein [Chloroflexota bacterium]|nr:MAG: glycosyltransferase family 1 protein [Chloroflexota bacterium]